MIKHCGECGDAIYGRSDKKFCSDQCRNAFNNQLNGQLNAYMKSINFRLRKNRRILDQLNPELTPTIHKNKLIQEGFSFKFYTHTEYSDSGNIYYFCYEHGYCPVDNELISLIKKEDQYFR